MMRCNKPILAAIRRLGKLFFEPRRTVNSSLQAMPRNGAGRRGGGSDGANVAAARRGPAAESALN
jgi:hypothetical protein